MAMGQNPNRTPSEHPNPTTKIGPKMGGDGHRSKARTPSEQPMGAPKTPVLTTTAASYVLDGA